MKYSFSFALPILIGYLFPALASAQTPLVTVYEVQGSGLISPFNGQQVQLDSSIVTFANTNFAYVEAVRGDDDPMTSDGILITDGPLLSLVPGDLVLVTGRVSESNGSTSIGGSSTTINKIGTTTLPTPPLLQLTTNAPAIPEIERYEGMRVQFDLQVGQGSTEFNSVRAYTTGIRPFREPGLAPPGINGLPLFDENPEIFSYDPNGLGQTNFQFYNAGDRVTGVGIMEQFSFGYELSPISPVTNFFTEPIRDVRARTDKELSIASFNVLFLLEDESDYAIKLTKVVNYIDQVLHFPDVIGIQELGGQSELEDLIFRLRQLDPESGNYQGFVGTGTGSIFCAFLVNRRIENPSAQQLATSEFLSTGGILHDRPPFLLTFDVPGDPNTQLQVLNLHVRSLNGIETSSFVRQKRHEQGVSIARLVEDLRDDNLLVIGDYNAFEFSDGYVDVFNQISGLPSLGALIPTESVVSPPLTVVEDILPPEERYSFVFRGSAQQLDHCLSNELTGLTLNDMQFARGNADASVNYGFQAFELPRSSDHDPFVVYLGIDELTDVASVSSTRPVIDFANPNRGGGSIQFQQLPTNTIMQLRDVAGRIIKNYDLTASPSAGTINLPGQLAAGMYYLHASYGAVYRILIQ